MLLQAIERMKTYFMCAFTIGRTPWGMVAILWRESKNLRVRLRLSSYHPQHVYALSTRYGPLHFRENFGDITNLSTLFYKQVYQVKKLAREGAIVDAGANIGLAAAWFAHHNPGRPVHCFEPLAENAALIPLNCPHARVTCVALGRDRGKIKLNVDPDCVMASHIPCRWETLEREFDVLPLDEYAREQGLGQVALLKIDAEGMELDILEGGREMLGRTHQVVLESHGATNHESAMDVLKKLGFRIDKEESNGATGIVVASRPT